MVHQDPGVSQIPKVSDRIQYGHIGCILGRPHQIVGEEHIKGVGSADFGQIAIGFLARQAKEMQMGIARIPVLQPRVGKRSQWKPKGVLGLD